MPTQVTNAFVSQMSTATHITLAKPIPRRARSAANRPASPSATKQLAAKTGSASAPDPHATRTARPPRTTISKLMIVRVPQSKADEEAAENVPKKLQRRQTVERASGLQLTNPTRLSLPSTSLSTRTSSIRPAPVKRTSSARVSFASTPFAPLQQSQLAVSSRKHAKTVPSPFLTLMPFERLAPAQLYDLARSSSMPSANVIPTEYAPSSLFMPLTEDVYLPFLDRPTEVLELLTRSDNKNLMVLFARILPVSYAAYYPRSSAELAATVGSWTFEDFTTWLTQISREEIEDEEWVRALRLFVLPKSEVLWERLKGMLGVPPELDVDPEFEDEEKLRLSARNTALNITPIYPATFSSGRRLDKISEVAEERTSNFTDEIVGLRILTSTTVPRPASIVKISQTVPSSPRARSPTQGYAPAVSSPLVPKSLRQPRPRSAPPQKNISSAFFPGILSRIRSRDMACPMFPTSFDKLGVQPTILHIV